MPLSDESKFGVRALSAAINRVPAKPTQIRDLALFEAKSLTTTYAEVENQDGTLVLIQSKPRGSTGDSLQQKKRQTRLFQIPHLPIDDVVRADDVQNVRGFGKEEAETVEAKVNELLGEGKESIEFTREHLQLGALGGKILDKDGDVMYDLYKEFDLKRQTHTFALSSEKTEVGALIDKVLADQRKLLKGAMTSGWVALCSYDFVEKLKYHPSIKAMYERYREASLYREGNKEAINPIVFEHNGVKFIHYTGEFGTAADIKAGEAFLLPVAKGMYKEYFAPADMVEFVNTMGKPYYASREKAKHGKGWELHMQSNPLPMVLRPELVSTLKMA